jgi:hypothetical protein
MAILIRGKTICRLCGCVIGAQDDVAMFPAFISNELDPLRLFDDGAFHASCFAEHVLAANMNTRFREFERQPRPPRCAVCGEQILVPAEYVDVGHLTSDPKDALFEFNYLRFHRSHLRAWPKRIRLRQERAAHIAQGKLKSAGYDLLLEALADVH